MSEIMWRKIWNATNPHGAQCRSTYRSNFNRTRLRINLFTKFRIVCRKLPLVLITCVQKTTARNMC